MGSIGFLTKNKRRFESRVCVFTPSAPRDSKRTENEHIRNICFYSDNVPATYRPDGKSAKKSSLFEGVELAARCAELLPSAFGRHLPLRGRSYFLYNYFLRSKKSSLFEGAVSEAD